jgi:hypothetical protein
MYWTSLTVDARASYFPATVLELAAANTGASVRGTKCGKLAPIAAERPGLR